MTKTSVKLQRIRIKAKLSQQQLAVKMGVSRSRVERIEKAGENITLRTLQNYLDACSFDLFLLCSPKVSPPRRKLRIECNFPRDWDNVWNRTFK